MEGSNRGEGYAKDTAIRYVRRTLSPGGPATTARMRRVRRLQYRFHRTTLLILSSSAILPRQQDIMDHSHMDHGNMGHGGMDHGGMDHGNMCNMNVSRHHHCYQKRHTKAEN
jgi:hypothetical protein